MTAFNKQSDKLVAYTGKDFPNLGIKKGDTYDVVAVAIAEGLDKMGFDNTVDLSCLLGTNCDKDLNIFQAVEKMKDVLCNMRSDDFITGANTFGLASANNVSSASLTNTSATYNASLSGSNMVFSWNMSQIVSSLPANHTLISARVTGYGTSQNNNVVAQSSQIFGSFNVPTGSFPASIELNMRIGTPSGSIDLSRTVSFAGATPTGGDIGVTLFPTGGSNTGTEMTQRQFNELLAATLSNQQRLIDNLLQNQ
jgi:hypothetical protein